MDSIRFDAETREFELFLTQGASMVPEPVYERETRRYADNVGNRTMIDVPHDFDHSTDGEVYMIVEIDFVNRSISTRTPESGH